MKDRYGVVVGMLAGFVLAACGSAFTLGEQTTVDSIEAGAGDPGASALADVTPSNEAGVAPPDAAGKRPGDAGPDALSAPPSSDPPDAAQDARDSASTSCAPIPASTLCTLECGPSWDGCSAYVICPPCDDAGGRQKTTCQEDSDCPNGVFGAGCCSAGVCGTNDNPSNPASCNTL